MTLAEQAQDQCFFPLLLYFIYNLYSACQKRGLSLTFLALTCLSYQCFCAVWLKGCWIVIDRQQIVMNSGNCFQNCYKACCDSDSEAFRFKRIKGLKCVTKEKRDSLKSGNFMPTHSSYTIEKNKYEEIPLKKHIVKWQTVAKPRRFESMGRVVESRLRSSSVQRESFHSTSKPPQQPSKVNQSVEHRQRRYSLDSTPKPQITFGGISMFSKEKQQSITLSQKQNSRINTETTVPMVEEQSKTLPYGIQTIKEEQQEKGSSFFQGAKSIVSRFVTSRKKDIRDTLINQLVFESEKKVQRKNVQAFFDQARMCETKVAIFTDSSIQIQQKKNNGQQISLDFIPMSPQTQAHSSQRQFNVGRLLGVGKWAHVYLCQDKQTGSIFALNEIFKQSLQMVCDTSKFISKISQLQQLEHCNLVSVYSKFQTAQKLCLLVEYCNSNLFEEIKMKGLLTIGQIKKYTSDLVKAIVYLHQNERVHGNVNIFNAFLSFGQCKLKHSLSVLAEHKQEMRSFRQDIEGLAITVFEMGHGLLPFVSCVETQYQKQKMYKDPTVKEKIFGYMNNRIELGENQIEYNQLNDFVRMLMLWSEDCRLTSGNCFNHAFLNEKEQ